MASAARLQGRRLGAEKVPSGAYLGDRDLFLFLVDGNRAIDDPTDTSQGGLFRGFILRNSDVGAAALSLEMFLFRAVCGNHIIWGLQHVVGFRRRHVGASIHEAWHDSLTEIAWPPRRRRGRGSDPALASDLAGTRVLAPGGPRHRDPGAEKVPSGAYLVSQKVAGEAYDVAATTEPNPRSVWGYVQGLTRLSQRLPWQDQRFALDQAASRLLATVD